MFVVGVYNSSIKLVWSLICYGESDQQNINSIFCSQTGWAIFAAFSGVEKIEYCDPHKCIKL